MIRRLSHLCFYSDDAPRLLDFYQNQLGLPVKFTLDNAAGVPFGWYIDLGETTFLEIFDQKLACEMWGGQPADLHEGTYYRHFCLEVVGLEAFKATLEGRGVAVGDIKQGMSGSFQAWITDPDGHAIELMEYTSYCQQLGGPGR